MQKGVPMKEMKAKNVNVEQLILEVVQKLRDGFSPGIRGLDRDQLNFSYLFFIFRPYV